jgi:hypothetical protein
VRLGEECATLRPKSDPINSIVRPYHAAARETQEP